MSSADSVHSAHGPPKEAAKPSIEDEQNAEAEKNFQLKSVKFWSIMSGVYLSIFLVALDRLIIATAIPSITNEFHSIEDIGWYGSAYTLTSAIADLLFGRIYQLYSTKWVFLASILIFEVGSALCGAAPNSVAFIIGRAIAGIGAGGIFCGGIMVMIPLVPLRKRPVFTAFFGVAFAISSALGPLIGGAFTDNPHLTWRWCFYINLPIGAFTLATVFFFLHVKSPAREKTSLLGGLKRLDPLGLLFFAPSMVCLILALQWGGTTYPWSAPRVIALLVVFGVLLIAFLAVEAWKPDTAMAPPRVALNRSVASSLVYMFFLSGGMLATVYYLTIWFQAAQGQSAEEAGIRTIPLLLSLVVMSVLAGALVQTIGYYNPALLLSPVLCAVGSGLLSTLTPSSGSGKWIGYQIMYGLGIGSGFQTSTLVPQTVLPTADVSLGLGMVFFVQQLGGAVFISVGQNIFAGQVVKQLSGLPGLDAQSVVNTGATDLRSSVLPSQVETVVTAYSYALTRVLILAAALSAAMILGAVGVEWKSIKKEKAPRSETGDVEEGKSEAKE